MDVDRVPDDELVRGLSAGDAREHEPRLPGRELRHQVRPARADRRRRRRLPRAPRRHRAARPARDRAAALAGAGAAHERSRAPAGRALRARGVPGAAGRASLRATIEQKPLRTRIDAAQLRAEPAAARRAPTRSNGACARPRSRWARSRPGKLLELAGACGSTAAAASPGSTPPSSSWRGSSDESGAVTALPLRVKPAGERFRLARDRRAPERGRPAAAAPHLAQLGLGDRRGAARGGALRRPAER